MIVYTCMYMFGCLVNGVCMCGLAVVLAFGALQAFTGISLTVVAHICLDIPRHTLNP